MNTWKCYRCNLSFAKIDHAKMHNEITNHDSQIIELVS
jgi:hypothetical protein